MKLTVFGALAGGAWKVATPVNAKAPPERGSRAVGDGAVTVIVGG